MIFKIYNSSLAMIFCVSLLIGCSPKASTSNDPNVLLTQGWDNFRTGDYDQAVKCFSQIMTQNPESNPIYLQALYGLATTWNLRRPGEKPALAIELYTRLAEKAPESDLAGWSLLALARMKHVTPVGTEPDYEQVRPAYQKVIDRYPKHPAAEEAFLYQQTTWIASLRPEDARKALSALEQFVTDHPKGGFTSTAWSLIGRCHAILKEPEKNLYALIQEVETHEIDPNDPYADHSIQYWTIANVAEFDVGDFQTARSYYNRFIKEYPQDFRVYPAKLALERMNKIEAEIRAGKDVKSWPMTGMPSS